jgi:hypothetical protein
LKNPTNLLARSTSGSKNFTGVFLSCKKRTSSGLMITWKPKLQLCDLQSLLFHLVLHPLMRCQTSCYQHFQDQHTTPEHINPEDWIFIGDDLAKVFHYLSLNREKVSKLLKEMNRNPNKIRKLVEYLFKSFKSFWKTTPNTMDMIYWLWRQSNNQVKRFYTSSIRSPSASNLTIPYKNWTIVITAM